MLAGGRTYTDRFTHFSVYVFLVQRDSWVRGCRGENWYISGTEAVEKERNLETSNRAGDVCYDSAVELKPLTTNDGWPAQ